MFLASKIQAHIQLLENRKTKIAYYLQSIKDGLPTEESKVSFQDRKRIIDIEQSLLRIDNQIAQYNAKLEHINSLTK